MLGAVAEFEPEVIKERTVAGMKAARKRGTHVGRPKALAASRLAEAGRMLAAGKSQIETARILRVSRATIQRAYPGGRRYISTNARLRCHGRMPKPIEALRRGAATSEADKPLPLSALSLQDNLSVGLRDVFQKTICSRALRTTSA